MGYGSYEQYRARVAEIEENLIERIEGVNDPIQAIQLIRENEGVNLKVVWETDSGYPFDPAWFCIIILPIVLGLIGYAVASLYEPKMLGKELYDEYGNRIVEYPRMPIAYLQQSHKDVSAVRENRNSLAWLCHRWLISTNDVVQELQSPYPLAEEPRIERLPRPLKFLMRFYNRFLQAAVKSHEKSNKKEEVTKEVRSDVGTWRQIKMLTKPAPSTEVAYLDRKLVKSKILWKKLQAWSSEHSGRPFYDKTHKEDSQDSYWSSSETFSSDSGEHWKSYKGTVSRWARRNKLHAGWTMERRRRRIAGEEHAKLMKRIQDFAEDPSIAYLISEKESRTHLKPGMSSTRIQSQANLEQKPTATATLSLPAVITKKGSKESLQAISTKATQKDISPNIQNAMERTLGTKTSSLYTRKQSITTKKVGATIAYTKMAKKKDEGKK